MKNLGFSDALVPLVLAGTKTVTRRGLSAMRRYKVGDVCFVGEALVPHTFGFVAYRRDGVTVQPLPGEDAPLWQWKPRVLAAMYCPAWAARGFIRITDLRSERLFDITDEDALLEGVELGPWGFFDPGDPHISPHDYPREAFLGMWERINGAKSLAANPAVTRIGIEVVPADVAEKLRGAA